MNDDKLKNARCPHRSTARFILSDGNTTAGEETTKMAQRQSHLLARSRAVTGRIMEGHTIALNRGNQYQMAAPLRWRLFGPANAGMYRSDKITPLRQ
ncbi:hypothetical protein D3C80_922810 [compost metagenome]